MDNYDEITQMENLLRALTSPNSSLQIVPLHDEGNTDEMIGGRLYFNDNYPNTLSDQPISIETTITEVNDDKSRPMLSQIKSSFGQPISIKRTITSADDKSLPISLRLYSSTKPDPKHTNKYNVGHSSTETVTVDPFPFNNYTSQHIPRSLSSSQTNKAIVLDLDETLVHSFTDIKRYHELGLNKLSGLTPRTYSMHMRDVVTPRGQGTITPMWGIIRPHVKEFILFCFSYFKVVIVWSAGKYGYVHDIVKILFVDMPQPHAILTRDDCTKLDGNYDKNLNKLFNCQDLGKYVRPTNTLIIDDRLVSFSTCPNNGVLIPPYSPKPRISNMKSDDITLLQLRAWFLQDAVKESGDVRYLTKKSIFGQDMATLIPPSRRLPVDLSQVYIDQNAGFITSSSGISQFPQKLIKAL